MTSSIHSLQAKKNSGEKIVATTCYDATMARLLNATALDFVLVGDSLGMVMMGHTLILSV